jgi:hypothetical protein
MADMTLVQRTIGSLLALATMTLGSPAWSADWVYTDKTVDGTMTQYVDRSSIQRTGDIVQAWQRTDYVNDNSGAKKTVTFFENDCTMHRSRWLSSTVYYENGDIKQVSSPSDWLFAAPETMGERFEKFVCKR